MRFSNLITVLFLSLLLGCEGNISVSSTDSESALIITGDDIEVNGDLNGQTINLNQGESRVFRAESLTKSKGDITWFVTSPEGSVRENIGSTIEIKMDEVGTYLIEVSWQDQKVVFNLSVSEINSFDKESIYYSTERITLFVNESFKTLSLEKQIDGVSFEVSPPLPVGLSLDADNGDISGKPSEIDEEGTKYIITAKKSDEAVELELTLLIVPRPPANLNYKNTPYVFTRSVQIPTLNPQIEGGTVTSYTVAPTLPAGLTINSQTGEITGTPTTLDISGGSYVVSARNSQGQSSTQIHITVNDVEPSSLTYSTAPATYTKYVSATANTPTSAGGAVTAYTITPALPSGITMDPNTGIISGTPTSSDESGTTYTITASNSGGSTSTSFTISVLIPDYTWLGTTNSLWSNASNWKGGSAPGTTHTAVFDDECTTCSVTIDGSIDIQGLTMMPSFAGTLTQGAASTITVGSNTHSNIGGWTQHAGTFQGSSSNIRSDFVRIYGGTFASTSGELRVGYDHSFTSSVDTFALGAAGQFLHNNGTFYLDSEGNNSPSRRVFMFNLDRQLPLYNLEIDVESQTALPTDHFSDGAFNAHFAEISGDLGEIAVSNNLRIRNGQLRQGEIQFSGANAQFDCDSPVTGDICADPTTALGNMGEGGLTSIIFNAPSAQTYSFNDGAAASRFVIENTAGVTTSSSGSFNIAALHIANGGSFSAPSGTLYVGRYLNISYQSGLDFLFLENGTTFNHNNGHLILNFSTTYGDSRFGNVRIERPDLTLYDFTVDVRGAEQELENAYVLLEVPGSIVRVENNFVFRDGRIDSAFNSAPVLQVQGSYSSICPDLSAGICPLYLGHIILELTDASSSFSVATEHLEFVQGNGQLRFDLGASQTKTINQSLRANFVQVDSGTVHLAAGVILSSYDDLFLNGGAVTCGVGAHLYYNGSLNGTPGAGNDPSCYSQNQAPTLSLSCPTSAVDGDAYSCSGLALSDDDASHTYSLDRGHSCNWLSIHPTNGTISGTPGPGDVGNCQLRVKVDDEKYSDRLAWDITVTSP